MAVSQFTSPLLKKIYTFFSNLIINDADMDLPFLMCVVRQILICRLTGSQDICMYNFVRYCEVPSMEVISTYIHICFATSHSSTRLPVVMKLSNLCQSDK